MNETELKDLIALGEGCNIEFKSAFSSSIACDICAMANSIGGKILLGVDDNGGISGISNLNRQKSEIQSCARTLDPPLSVGVDAIGDILVITVPESRSKPHAAGGKFYLRSGSNTQQMNRNELKGFFFREGLIYFDETPNKKFTFGKNLSRKAFSNFRNLAGLPASLDMEHVLENLKLLESGTMTNAGVILFSSDITNCLLSATITCVLFRGTTKVKVLDQKEFSSDLYSNYSGTMKYIESHLNTEFIIKGGPREERLELPEEALREALLNSISHRDYSKSANIQVYIFSDRIEIVNPGGLVPGLSKEQLGKRSMPRNPLLFSIMNRMHLVEKIGSGMKRIEDSMSSYDMPFPEIIADDNWFGITFKRQATGRDPHDEVARETKGETKGETKRETKGEIIHLLQQNPDITIPELAKKLGLSDSGIEYNIRQLKKQGRIKRKGSTKDGTWEILS